MVTAVDQGFDTRPAAARAAEAPSQVTPPARREGSLRRTIVMQSLWPDGPAGAIRILGTGRDLWTAASSAQVIDEDGIDVLLTADKVIARLAAKRGDVPAAEFAGVRPGGAVRKAMAIHLPDDVADATLLHRLLDDLGGTSFMAACAWHDWLPRGIEDFEVAAGGPPMLHRSVEGVCISFQPGSPAMTPDGRTNHAFSSHPDARLPWRDDDPLAWHDFEDRDGPNHWRIRYTDIWFDGPVLRVTAGFQDSSSLHARRDRRVLFHEYVLAATVDPGDWTLIDIDVTAGSLPFSSCLAAPRTATALVGQSLATFGTLVPDMLPGIAGCTHLNEVLRNLRDVPAMARRLALSQSETPPLA